MSSENSLVWCDQISCAYCALTKLFLRFEFDISVEDARQRVLSVCLKHSSSFMSRDKDLIGQVSQQLADFGNRLSLSYSNGLSICNTFTFLPIGGY